jgi:hypothetical protein
VLYRNSLGEGGEGGGRMNHWCGDICDSIPLYGNEWIPEGLLELPDDDGQ